MRRVLRSWAKFNVTLTLDRGEMDLLKSIADDMLKSGASGFHRETGAYLLKRLNLARERY